MRSERLFLQVWGWNQVLIMKLHILAEQGGSYMSNKHEQSNPESNVKMSVEIDSVRKRGRPQLSQKDTDALIWLLISSILPRCQCIFQYPCKVMWLLESFFDRRFLFVNSSLLSNSYIKHWTLSTFDLLYKQALNTVAVRKVHHTFVKVQLKHSNTKITVT